MKKIPILFVAFMMCLVSQQKVFGQKVWEKTSKEWTLEDCIKILNDSPWAINFSDIAVEYDSKVLNENILVGKTSPAIVLRAYSSSIVRQALVRMNQIGNKYDTLTETDKLRIDKANFNILNCELCKNYYIFILVQPATSNASATLIGRRFKDVKHEQLKDRVYLTNDKNERRELAQYVAPTSESGFAIFYFNRFDEKNVPLITENSKKLNVILKVDPYFKYLFDNKAEFNISKMKIDGKIDL